MAGDRPVGFCECSFGIEFGQPRVILTGLIAKARVAISKDNITLRQIKGELYNLEHELKGLVNLKQPDTNFVLTSNNYFLTGLVWDASPLC